SGDATTLMPPAFPRPPAWTWALTTTLPPSRAATARAAAGESATSPRGTGTPNSFRRALAWYSWIRTLLAGHLAEEPQDRVVVAIDHALLEGDDAVVGDVDVLGADLGAALGDVAQPDPTRVAGELPAVGGVERVHLQLGQPDEEAGAREAPLLLVVVPDD